MCAETCGRGGGGFTDSSRDASRRGNTLIYGEYTLFFPGSLRSRPSSNCDKNKLRTSLWRADLECACAFSLAPVTWKHASEPRWLPRPGSRDLSSELRLPQSCALLPVQLSGDGSSICPEWQRILQATMCFSKMCSADRIWIPDRGWTTGGGRGGGWSSGCVCADF